MCRRASMSPAGRPNNSASPEDLVHQPQEDLDQRRLAGAVGSEQAEDLASSHAERDASECGRRDAGQTNRRDRFSTGSRVSMASEPFMAISLNRSIMIVACTGMRMSRNEKQFLSSSFRSVSRPERLSFRGTRPLSHFARFGLSGIFHAAPIAPVEFPRRFSRNRPRRRHAAQRENPICDRACHPDHGRDLETADCGIGPFSSITVAVVLAVEAANTALEDDRRM